MLWQRTTTKAALGALILFGGTASAQEDLTTLRVIVFPGGFNWPIFAAMDQGFFEENGLRIELTPTPDSKFQMVGLIDGDFEIAMTAMDNVIAYDVGQGAAPTDQNPDVIAFMGNDNGFLRMMALPEIESYEDLQGRDFGVDALTTGYAFVARRMLEAAGLSLDDVNVVEAGGGMQRQQALQEGSISATLLISPLEAPLEAEASLGSATARIPWAPIRASSARRGARGPRIIPRPSSATYGPIATRSTGSTSPTTAKRRSAC